MRTFEFYSRADQKWEELRNVILLRIFISHLYYPYPTYRTDPPFELSRIYGWVGWSPLRGDYTCTGKKVCLGTHHSPKKARIKLSRAAVDPADVIAYAG